MGGNYEDEDDTYDDEAINSSYYLNGILYTMTLYQDQYRMIADNDLMVADGDMFFFSRFIVVGA